MEDGAFREGRERWRRRYRRFSPTAPVSMHSPANRAGKRRDPRRRLHSAGPDSHPVVRSRFRQTPVSFRSQLLTPYPPIFRTRLPLSFSPFSFSSTLLYFPFFISFFFNLYFLPSFISLSHLKLSFHLIL